MPTLARNAKSEKGGMKREKSDAKYPLYTLFVFRNCFRVFCNKCIAGLRAMDRMYFPNVAIMLKNKAAF